MSVETYFKTGIFQKVPSLPFDGTLGVVIWKKYRH